MNKYIVSSNVIYSTKNRINRVENQLENKLFVRNNNY